MAKPKFNSILLFLLLIASPVWATVSSEFEPPRRYRQPFAVIDFDAQPQASALIERSRMDYQAALDSAIAMEGEIERFLATPTEESLTAARDAPLTVQRDVVERNKQKIRKACRKIVFLFSQGVIR